MKIMSVCISKRFALEVLGLPTFASLDDIIYRYRILAYNWYPERNNNSEIAYNKFKEISEAAAILLNPIVKYNLPMNLLDMYQLFQSLFFKVNTENSESEGDDDNFVSLSDLAKAAYDISTNEKSNELEATVNANQLILEEEQEKLKSERKRAKKKRRKERKKQQKAETENHQKKISSDKQTSTSSKETEVKANEVKEGMLSDSEESIDTGSAFVAVVAKKHKHLLIPELKAKIENPINPLLPPEIKEDPISIVLRSRQLALRANELASLNHFSEAVNLFSESIKLNPSDHRFYGNRSYCFDRLGHFDRALKDADRSIALCPSWPKGYYRKGRALLGLKKYAQAEECFMKVLKLDNDCDDAISEMHKVKVLQIMEMGYSRQQAEAALAKHSSVQESIQSLLSSGIAKMKSTEKEVFISDDESDEYVVRMPHPKTTQSAQYDIKMDPRNPENHNSLWIGNIQPEATEKKLINLFSKYGELLSVKAMPEKHCAFINYKNKNAPGKAMQALQGHEFCGANLVIRFPNLPGETTTKKVSVQDASKLKSNDECYFWRTTGCIYGENCRNRHIKESKGIDKKKYQVVS